MRTSRRHEMQSKTAMKTAARIVLVMMLFALAMLSVATSSAEALAPTVRRTATAPAVVSFAAGNADFAIIDSASTCLNILSTHVRLRVRHMSEHEGRCPAQSAGRVRTIHGPPIAPAIQTSNCRINRLELNRFVPTMLQTGECVPAAMSSHDVDVNRFDAISISFRDRDACITAHPFTSIRL